MKWPSNVNLRDEQSIDSERLACSAQDLRAALTLLPRSYLVDAVHHSDFQASKTLVVISREKSVRRLAVNIVPIKRAVALSDVSLRQDVSCLIITGTLFIALLMFQNINKPGTPILLALTK